MLLMASSEPQTGPAQVTPLCEPQSTPLQVAGNGYHVVSLLQTNRDGSRTGGISRC